MDEPRRIPVHRSLNRPHLLLGGERELVQFSGLIAIFIVLSAMTLLSVACGFVFWTLAMAILIRMGRTDPQLSKVYQRHIRYRPYYPPKTGANARPAGIQTWKV
jgi:type IV secretion system protein TrbD